MTKEDLSGIQFEKNMVFFPTSGICLPGCMLQGTLGNRVLKMQKGEGGGSRRDMKRCGTFASLTGEDWLLSLQGGE